VRIQDAQTGQTRGRQRCRGETGHEHSRIDAAEKLHQTQDGQPRQNEESQVAEPRDELTEDDFPVFQIGGQEKLERLFVLFLGNRSRDIGRSQQRDGNKLRD
jgi:hypothetical protein